MREAGFGDVLQQSDAVYVRHPTSPNTDIGRKRTTQQPSVHGRNMTRRSIDLADARIHSRCDHVDFDTELATCIHVSDSALEIKKRFAEQVFLSASLRDCGVPNPHCAPVTMSPRSEFACVRTHGSCCAEVIAFELFLMGRVGETCLVSCGS